MSFFFLKRKKNVLQFKWFVFLPDHEYSSYQTKCISDRISFSRMLFSLDAKVTRVGSPGQSKKSGAWSTELASYSYLLTSTKKEKKNVTERRLQLSLFKEKTSLLRSCTILCCYCSFFTLIKLNSEWCN